MLLRRHGLDRIQRGDCEHAFRLPRLVREGKDPCAVVEQVLGEQLRVRVLGQVRLRNRLLLALPLAPSAGSTLSRPCPSPIMAPG